MRLQALKDRITDRRTSAQKWLYIKEFAQTNPGLGKKPGTSPSTTNFNGLISKSLGAYNSPSNDPNCRICQVLESNGDTDSLYNNHHFNFATGCPNYIMKSMGKYTRQDPPKQTNTPLKFSERLCVTYKEISEELKGWHPQFPQDLLKFRATIFNPEIIFNSRLGGLMSMATKATIQMNCKLGGEPWIVVDSDITLPERYDFFLVS